MNAPCSAFLVSRQLLHVTESLQHLATTNSNNIGSKYTIFMQYHCLNCRLHHGLFFCFAFVLFLNIANECQLASIQKNGIWHKTINEKCQDVHRTTKSLLSIFSGDCKAKDRPQFGLKWKKKPKQQQQQIKKTNKPQNTSDWKQRQVSLLKSQIQTWIEQNTTVLALTRCVLQQK